MFANITIRTSSMYIFKYGRDKCFAIIKNILYFIQFIYFKFCCIIVNYIKHNHECFLKTIIKLSKINIKYSLIFTKIKNLFLIFHERSYLNCARNYCIEICLYQLDNKYKQLYEIFGHSNQFLSSKHYFCESHGEISSITDFWTQYQCFWTQQK